MILIQPAQLGKFCEIADVVQARVVVFIGHDPADVRPEKSKQRGRMKEESPLEPGLAVAELLPAEPWAQAVLPLLPVERRGAIAYLPGVAASLGERAEAADALRQQLDASGLAAVKSENAELARFLETEGALVRLGDGFVVSAAAYEQARDLVLTECGAAGEITLARFRDLAGVGRRDAQLLLERLDQDGITRRLGDRRVLRRAGRDG